MPDPMLGIRISTNKWLPQTVLDKDGNEVELLGVCLDSTSRYPDYTLESLVDELNHGTITLITGKVVKHA